MEQVKYAKIKEVSENDGKTRVTFDTKKLFNSIDEVMDYYEKNNIGEKNESR